MSLQELLLPGMTSIPHPLYAAAVAVTLRDGEVVDHAVVGDATSLVVDPSSGTVAILLTNRIHPSRAWSDITSVRRAVADLVG